MGKMKISIVIPVKNEALMVKKTIDEVRIYADEIIVVDGSSIDGSAEKARAEGALVFKDPGKGKGCAVRIGIEKASGDIIIFIDCDGSHEASDIPDLVKPILEGRADMVVASRGRGGSDELHGDVEKFMRLIGSSIITLIINIRWKQALTDSQNGFRAIKKEAAQSLNLTEKITTIEQEMVMKCLKKGYRIEEIPSHEYARKNGLSNIVLSRVWFRYIWCLLKNLI